jgi:hypothetical protein
MWGCWSAGRTDAHSVDSRADLTD